MGFDDPEKNTMNLVREVGMERKIAWGRDCRKGKGMVLERRKHGRDDIMGQMETWVK